MPRGCAIVLLVLGLALAACGKDDAALTGGGGATSSQEERTDAPPAEDAATLKRLAEKYLRGVSSGDYRAACQTRSRAERREFARIGGSCPKVFERLGRTGDTDFPSLRGATVREDEIALSGGVARIPFFRPGSEEPAGTLSARREDGRYRLFDDLDRE